jgi:hypothetical protein
MNNGISEICFLSMKLCQVMYLLILHANIEGQLSLG